MRCILHIGTEKTATTSIQNWLYANRATLSENRVALSDVAETGNNRALCAWFQPEIDDYLLDKGVRDEAGKAVWFATFIDDFEAEIKQAARSHDTMIISSEHFHRRMTSKESIEALRDFLYRNFSSVEIVCYFREQSEVRKSLYSTGVKGGDTRRIADFQNEDLTGSHYYNYRNMLGKWSDIFGRSAIRPRLFQRKLFRDRDIRKDFLDVCNLSRLSDSMNFDTPRENESLTRFQAFLARQVNTAVPRYDRHGNYSWLRDRLVYVISHFRIFRLGGRIRDPRQLSLHAAFDAENRKFFRDYFGADRNLFPPPREPAGALSRTRSLLTATLRTCLRHAAHIVPGLRPPPGAAAPTRKLSVRAPSPTPERQYAIRNQTTPKTC
ncbi:hypothetical protein GOB93_16255 [Acetobacter musti]|uniref:Sulfotransferase domain-containing protein n=1 Tax=Acetobacter musti TaxID=864732 RepID=A0ABX0JWF5_9PROT|nr:hypothetical protein [Acetobacter musti]NHN86182.1 hypothetical protein [Acetobacter musti]